MSVICPNCKRPVAKGSNFCSFCGSQIVAAPTFRLLEMTCSRCGAPVQYGDSVETAHCNFCGNEMYVNDKVSEYSRKLKAETAAEDRRTDTKIRYEKAKVDNRKKLAWIELLHTPFFWIVVLVILIILAGLVDSCIAFVDRIGH